VTDQPAPSPSPAPVPLSEEQVDKTRAWTGLYVVVGGDVGIAVAAVVALIKLAGSTNANSAVIAAVLSSAFAAISTMTTAYFGIRESANTAQRVKQQTATPPS
jgi:Na+/melibiose symporter-like transporter